MPEEAIVKFVEIIPSLVNSAILVFVIVILKKPIIENILPKIVEFKGLGLEVKLIENQIRNVEAKRARRVKDSSLNYDLSVLDRVNRNSDIVKNKRILWVDDDITKIKEETEILNELGINVDISTSGVDAIDKLNTLNYDLILSDIMRKEDGDNGLAFAKRVSDEGINTPIIFYISNLEREKGTPAHAFGITNRFDELLHLVVDSFSRRSTK